MSCRTWSTLLLVTFIALTACGRAIESPQVDESQLETRVAATLSAMPEPTNIATLELPTATTVPATKILWTCYSCRGDRMWVLGDGEPYERTLPVSMGEYHGWNGESDRILFSKEFTSHGAGPGNVSVRDLSILNLTNSAVEVIHSDNVVEAQWAPDGHAIAYILATESTYELHWRTLDGMDRVLAENVTFTWSVAPSGKAIAYTRETGYELDIDPGLYLVRVDTEEEIKISDVDKHGTGSIADRPVWSPDSTEVILAHWGGPDEPRLVWAKSDGSASADLAIDPSHSEEWWYTISIPFLLWDLDGDHLIGAPAASKEMLGGPSPLVYYFFDRDSYTLTGGVLLAEISQLIGWAVPGESVWVRVFGGDFQEVPLPFE
ncbi:MAG: hypothetical protein GTO14_15650 [Anaerolineales bacterium]|nr:hypothetical protein [Anaerolineales bacterium]